MDNNPNKLIPALIGGGVIAVLSTFPVISLANCFCCMWIILGGALAAYIYSRELSAGEYLTTGDGALVGLLAGLFGALFSTFLSTFFMLIGFNFSPEILKGILESQKDLPPEFENFMHDFNMEEGFSSFLVIVNLIVNLIVNPIFATLGGLLAGVFMSKQQNKSSK